MQSFPVDPFNAILRVFHWLFIVASIPVLFIAFFTFGYNAQGQSAFEIGPISSFYYLNLVNIIFYFFFAIYAVWKSKLLETSFNDVKKARAYLLTAFINVLLSAYFFYHLITPPPPSIQF
jgi:hypothetical protein